MLDMRNRRNWLSGIFLCAAALGFLDTARAQTVTITQNGQTLSGPLSFTTATGTLSASQTLNVSTPPNNGNTVVVTVPSQYAQWLIVSPGVIANTPGQISVNVNAGSLGVGTQAGYFMVQISNNPASAQTVLVNATITGASALSASPASLSFTAQAGQTSGTPQGCAQQNFAGSCQIAISSSAGTLAYNVSWTPANSWLVPDQFSGSTGGAAMNVSVNPANLSAGVYTGEITVQSKTTSDAVTIAVTLTVTASATLTATPSTLNFYYTSGGTAPPAQQVTVSSTGSAIAFNVNQSAGSQSWLKVSILSGVASSSNPATLMVSVTPAAGMTPGPYTATLNLTSPNSSASVSVTLVVSQNPFLTVSANQLAFSAPFAGTPPPAQGLTVGTTGGPLNFTATASSSPAWLTVSPSGGVTGTQSAQLTVGISQAGLNALSVGSYQGTITIAPTNGDPYSLVVQVTLTVGVNSTLVAAPSQLVFSYQTGQAQPPAQTVELLSTGPSQAFTITTTGSGAANCGSGTWLSAMALQSPQATPNTLSVSVNTTGMTAGTCNGVVHVFYNGLTGPAETDVQVTLFVSSSPLLTISLPNGFGYDAAPLGSTTPIQHTIGIGSTDGSAIQYSVAPQSAPCPWLAAAPATGSNPGTSPTQIQIQILPGCVTTPGIYPGGIQISSPGLPSPVMLSLNLVVTSTVQISVTPQSLTFNESQGGTQPPPQTLNFTVSGGNAAFVATASSNFNWLTVTPASGNTSLGKISVSVNNNTLPAQTYNGSIYITFVNAETPSATIPVQLIVGPPQSLSASPASLTFSYQLGGSAPASQNVTLTSTGGPVNFSVAANSTGGWLGASPASGSTGSAGSQTVAVSINPANIPANAAAGQSLMGTISITAPGVLANPITIAVTLNITAAPTPLPSTISTSAVSNGYGAIAPGELITIKGTNLGPSPCEPPAACAAVGYSFTVNADGTVSSTLKGVQVLFDGIPGTPTYVSPTQINVIVPWEIAGRTSTNIVVSYNNVPSASIPEQVVPVAPGIYTQNATGSGQAAAVNLSPTAASIYNGPAGQVFPGTNVTMAPAAAGTAIALYLTGGGLTSPASVTGTINPPAAVPLAGWTQGSGTVTATIGGQPATVLYAGAAPTLITGVVQINLQIPQGVHGSALPVVITIDGVSTQTTATIAVQ
jgi:uncharacterized protein (TIGR03437 family)